MLGVPIHASPAAPVHRNDRRLNMRSLTSLVEELEQNRSLDLSQRIEALDRLEAHLLDTELHDPAIYHRAQALSAFLEAANLELYRAIRREIRTGAQPQILRQAVQSVGLAQGEAYDYLDELLIGVLQFEDPAAVAPLPPEMVPYQPTPARHIFDLLARTALTEHDVLVDLGSGLGHVPLLASICTPARSIGIELDPAYIECARHSAQDLNLHNVTFLEQDARTADLSLGTVFYLYTPFTGAILRTVLDALSREASRRQFRICTFGPCTPIIAQENWLEPPGTLATDQIAVFHLSPRTPAPG